MNMKHIDSFQAHAINGLLGMVRVQSQLHEYVNANVVRNLDHDHVHS